MKKKILFEKFIAKKKLGAGGNAIVFKVKDTEDGNEYALKSLYKGGRYYDKKIQRFLDEVKAVTSVQYQVKGVIPIIKSNIESEPYWYIMPIAEPVEEYIASKKTPYFYAVIDAIGEIAKHLAVLHERGIVHRDIKPSNMYYYDGGVCLGDFGLVEYPEKEDITQEKESVGAKHTIAPEFKRNADTADGRKGDVYSLAKTMWMLLTKQPLSFDGQYVDNDCRIGLRNYHKNRHIVEIEDLLYECTDNDPDKRPSMSEFNERLLIWEKIEKNFELRNQSQWKYVQKKIVGTVIPSSMEWTNREQIAEVLKLISSFHSLNHMFMPTKGGMDINKVDLAAEEGCIAIDDIILKPKRLVYENIGNDFKWGYFRLEANTLNEIFGEGYEGYFESITEITPGEYGSWILGNYGRYENGDKLPAGYNIVSRYLKGNFVIFSKSSIYNEISGTYDARHELCSRDAFREYIEKMREDYNQERDKSLFIKKYEKNPFSQEVDNTTDLDDLIIMEQEQESNKQLKTLIEERYKNITIVLQMNNTKPKNVVYSLGFEIESDGGDFLDEKIYVIEKSLKIEEYKYDIFTRYRLDKSNMLKVNTVEEIHMLQEAVKRLLEKMCSENNILYNEEALKFKIIMDRIRKPEHLFTKDEIEEVLRNGNDHVNNRLVIDVQGYPHLINGINNDVEFYAVRHEGYNAYNNYVGEYSTLQHLDDEYMSSLIAWKKHLEYGRSICISYYDNKKTEEELINEIEAILSQM